MDNLVSGIFVGIMLTIIVLLIFAMGINTGRNLEKKERKNV